MDPTAALAEMRALTAQMLDPDSDHVDTGDAVRLAELVQALDDSIAAGVLPVDWTTPRPSHPHLDPRGSPMPAPIRIIVKKPNEAPTVDHISRSLESSQAIVGGLIDVVRVAPGLDLVVNDEGLIHGLEPNFSILGAFGAVPIVGPVFFVSVDAEGNFVGLTDEQVEAVAEMWIFGHAALLVPDDDYDGDDVGDDVDDSPHVGA